METLWLIKSYLKMDILEELMLFFQIKISSGQIRLSQIMSDRVKLDTVELSQIKLDWVRSSQIKLDWVRSSQFWLGQIDWVSQIELGYVRWIQLDFVKSNQVR